MDRKHISEEDFRTLTSDTVEIGKMVGALMSYLAKTDLKGPKFKYRK
jgi:hypothetical protein